MKSTVIDHSTKDVGKKEQPTTEKKYPKVKLPDGRVLQVLPGPAKQKRKTGPSAGFSTNSEARTYLLIDNPSCYKFFDNMRMGTGAMGGSPGIYPRQLYSLMYALQNVLPLKAMCQNLKFPSHIQVIKEHLMLALPHVQVDDQVRINNWLINPKIPSPSHLGRLFNQIHDRGVDLDEFLQNKGIEIAIKDGRFSSNNDIYSQSNFLVGDGTVIKSASSKQSLEYIDIDTGEIRQRRTDFGSLFHTEGGGETVQGCKFLPVWSTSDDQHGTICMGVKHVPSTAPSVEADYSIELVVEIQNRLIELNSYASLLSYDRAAGQKVQEVLNNIGMVVGTRAFVDKDKQSGSHYRKPKYIGHHIAPCGHDQRFVSILKHLHHEVRDVNGKVNNVMLEHRLRPKRRGDRIFHYSEHPYTCWCSPNSIQTLRISWNGRKAALSASKNGIILAGDSGYENMLRYLQPHAPSSLDFKIVHGKRQTSESMHSIIDNLLPFKRLPRWSLESKTSWIYGYLIGHNLVYEQLRRPGAIEKLIG
jgi:hypothetical protein